MEKNKVNSMQVFVDKGLQSQSLADVLTTITESARYIREYPFPNFLHSTLFRLAQAFQGETFGRKFEHYMNTIRLRIVTAVRECSSSLSQGFTLSEEIIRQIMKVSHSNDYKARSLTLLLLASLAPLICDDKKVHNLVIESLDCVEPTEQSAAIHAANELTKYSISFSPLIVRKIAKMFGHAQQTSSAVKMELFGVLSQLRDLAMAQNCIDLGKALLESSEDDKMRAVIYYSLTQLANRSEAVLPDQICLLLLELNRNILERNKSLVHCILQNLTDLAIHQKQWSQENVEMIRDFHSVIDGLGAKGILCTWLHCLEVLSASKIHTKTFTANYSWSPLLSSPSIIIRIFAIKLSHNLLQTGQINDQLRQKLLDSILGTLCHFIANPYPSSSSISPLMGNSHGRIVGRLRREFLCLVSGFVRSPKCSPEFASSIARNLLTAELVGTNGDLFELLAVLSETYWAECRQIVSSALFEAIANAITTQRLAQVPSMVFTLLLSTTPTSLFGNNGDDDASNQHKLMALTEQLLAQTTTDSMNHWTLYLIARAALRFGHWRLMALPLLEHIQKSCENMETQSWISGLIHICRGQLRAFSVDQITQFESSLQSATLNFKMLASMEKNQPFAFAADYANCMHSTFRAIRSILVVINVKLLVINGGASGKINEFQRKSIVQSLRQNSVAIVDARQQWVKLCSKSFDADTQTLLQAGLMIRLCLLLEEFLGILCDPGKEPKLSVIPIEDLGISTKNNFHPSSQTQNFHALLNWARQELLAFHSSCQDPISNLKKLKQVLCHLANFPLGLPRFFFQRIQQTRIKLIISPQPSEGSTAFRVQSADLLPLLIEGIIETTNPKSIESVCVVLTLKRDNTAPTEKKQSVQLEADQKYFRAQFLLKISHQRTKISAKVLFVDRVTKRQWFDESDMASLTVELLDSGSGHHQKLQQQQMSMVKGTAMAPATATTAAKPDLI